MRIRQERRFKEDFAALPESMKRRARKQLGLFIENPHHPSLRTKKMKGANIWEGRITRSYRFTFEIVGDLYKLRRIGPHTILARP